MKYNKLNKKKYKIYFFGFKFKIKTVDKNWSLKIEYKPSKKII